MTIFIAKEWAGSVCSIYIQWLYVNHSTDIYNSAKSSLLQYGFSSAYTSANHKELLQITQLH